MCDPGACLTCQSHVPPTEGPQIEPPPGLRSHTGSGPVVHTGSSEGTSHVWLSLGTASFSAAAGFPPETSGCYWATLGTLGSLST